MLFTLGKEPSVRMATVETTRELRFTRIHQWKSRSARLFKRAERNPSAVLAGVAVLYVTLVMPLLLIKLLWADEFITLYISKLNSVTAIWHALARGADPNPPLTHIVTMWSMRIFGENAFAMRLPALLASGIGLICLVLFLRRRVPVVYAAAGACFFMSTNAFNYSYEARSYAFILGFAMLSMVLWQYSIEGNHPAAAAVGMAIALAAGLSSNYFAVLAFFPIAAGELVRDLERRKIEWKIWIALALGGLPIFAYMGLINHAIAKFSPYAWNKPRPDVIFDSYTEMVEVILWPALVLLAAGVIVYVRGILKHRRKDTPVLPRHEFAAVLVLMAYPFIAYVIAVARAGMLSPRFVIPLCYGFAIAVCVTAYRLFRRSHLAAAVVLLLCFSWAIARDGVCAYDYMAQRQSFFRILNRLPESGTIAVSDSLLVQPLYHYAPRQVAARIVFPLDFDAIHKYKKEDSLEQNFHTAKDLFPVPLVSLNDLEIKIPYYTIVTTQGNWLLRQFENDGVHAQLLPINTHSTDIGGFTPLCHGPAVLYEAGGDSLGQKYASTAPPSRGKPSPVWTRPERFIRGARGGMSQ